MEKDEVAARSVIQNKAVLLQKTDALAWFDCGQLCHASTSLLLSEESRRVSSQREYSKSREATSVLSSVGTGSLCLRRLAM